MVVNNRFFITTFITLFFASFIYGKTITEAERYVSKNVKEALVALSAQTEICKDKEKNTLVKITPDSLKEANISIDTFKVATMALNHINYTNCIDKEEKSFLYYSLIAYNMQKQNSIEDKDTLSASLILLPSNEVLQALAKYENLSQSIKAYFEKVIGSEPFDIIKVSMPVLDSLHK